jgi:cephalosporin hydroxylase
MCAFRGANDKIDAMDDSRMTRLIDLYTSHTGKVSDKWSSYLSTYDDWFRPYTNRPLRILEIGIQNGGSLEIWAKYFPNASLIVGCDINPLCAELSYDDAHIKVVVGDANTDDIRARIMAFSDTYDIIIDDGSHVSRDIVVSFAKYFPLLAEGGIYVAEDLHCSYTPSPAEAEFDDLTAGLGTIQLYP